MKINVRTLDNSVMNPDGIPASLLYSLYLYAWADEYEVDDNTVFDLSDLTYLYLKRDKFPFTLNFEL